MAEKSAVDPAIVDTVTNEGDTSGVRVEFDQNNDGVADGLTFVGSSGQFLLDPNVTEAGAMSVRVRAGETRQ